MQASIHQKFGLHLSIPIPSGAQQDCVLAGTPDPIEEEHSDFEEELLEVLEGVVSSTKEADSLTNQLKPTDPSDESTNLPANSTVSGTDSGTTVQPVLGYFSGEVASINHPFEARYQLSPKPPDIQSAKAELIVNKSLSKSALKRMRKQSKEQSQCSLISKGQ
ncbi:hypothetical protein RHSIM_Rhsim13G0130900 [Rhododendron simsii]|uniref:Uncharacterized protein n=1 Tax=Rhododendron simsii TaxID=118357 RepID=A0A834FYH5_RHOSS|nr:hypothetical protein RHSIM_Rhsim13G0130900 [Rhododendron simsii]